MNDFLVTIFRKFELSLMFACIIEYKLWILLLLVFLSFFEKRRAFCMNRKTKNVMNDLKLILTTASTLKSLNYSFLTDEIILIIDFSLKKWDVILFQINSETNKNHSSRYKSGLWTIFESKYNVIKRECCELLKALKKVRFCLYEMRFIIEIDVNTLIV